jgi:hypothetical protein
MTTKHTPGPWKLLEVGDRPVHLAPVDAENLSLLTVVEENGVKFAAVYDNDDARLIAASPEMLESLKAMIEMDWRVGPKKNEYEKAYLVVKKAEGR